MTGAVHTGDGDDDLEETVVVSGPELEALLVEMDDEETKPHVRVDQPPAPSAAYLARIAEAAEHARGAR